MGFRVLHRSSMHYFWPRDYFAPAHSCDRLNPSAIWHTTVQHKTPVQHIILIGSNKLSALYIDFLRAYAPARHRIIGLLDDRTEMVGRSVAGVRVLGTTVDLLPIINEFKEHGVCTDRIIVGGDFDLLPKEAMAEISHICSEYEIELDYVPRLVGLNGLQTSEVETQAETDQLSRDVFSPSPYFRIKHYVDFCLGLLLTSFCSQFF